MSGAIPIPIPPPVPPAKSIIPRRAGGRAGALGALATILVLAVSGIKEYVNSEKGTLEGSEILDPVAETERIIYVCTYRCGEGGRTFTRQYPLIQGGCPKVLQR